MGTMVSRVTGLIRTIVLVGLLGSVGSQVADAYSVANQLPTTVFNLISAGVLTSVLTPQIVRASLNRDGGNGFISKIFTICAFCLVLATTAVMAVAPWLIKLLLGNSGSDGQLAFATGLAYWCLPQIFFYGMYALIGETLNARRIFGPFTWAPVINNITSIVGFLVIGWFFGQDLTDLETWSPEMIGWLGGLSTAGIAAQAGVLLLFWRRTGLTFKFDFHWRGTGLRGLSRSASWTLLMSTMTMITGMFQVSVVSTASGVGASVTVMNNAWLIFMVPYSVIVYSIGTPYFTRISEAAVAGRDDQVRSDIGSSLRAIGVLVIGSAAALAAASTVVSRVFTNSAGDAETAGIVLLSYLAGMLPLAVLFILQRVFYAYGDTKTPFVFTAVQCLLILAVTAAVGRLGQADVIEPGKTTMFVALSQSLVGIVQTVLAAYLLRHRLGSLAMRDWGIPLVRFLVASIPAGLAGWGLFMLQGGSSGWMAADKWAAILGAALIGLATLLVYAIFLRIMRDPDLRRVTSLLKHRSQ